MPGISVAAVAVVEVEVATSALTVALWRGVTPSSSSVLVVVVVGVTLARRSDSLTTPIFSVLWTERGERVVMVISMPGRTVVLSSVSTLLEVTIMATLAWLLFCEFTRLTVVVSGWEGRGEGGGGTSVNNGKYYKWQSDS